MKAGITGLPYCGKTTLFCALTGQDYEHIAHHRDVHIGTVKVPDTRLEHLYEILKPKKITYATMEYFDVAGQEAGHGKAMEPVVLQTLKNADSLIVVLDSFSKNSTPEHDFNSFMEEFALNDLIVATNRLKRLEKDIRSGKTEALLHEQVLIDRCRKVLEEGGMLRDCDFGPDEEKMLRGFQFLTRKPILLVINISEKLLAEGKSKEIEKRFGSQMNASCAAISAEIEMEIAVLDDPEDRAEFLESMGIEEQALDRLIQVSYESMGLISFFTGVGADEVKAWTVRRNTRAVECAGVIHSDMERGFIRAETISHDDLVNAGSLKTAREQGLLRVEGKDYIVQDGDVLNIRFNV